MADRKTMIITGRGLFRAYKDAEKAMHAYLYSYIEDQIKLYTVKVYRCPQGETVDLGTMTDFLSSKPGQNIPLNDVFDMLCNGSTRWAGDTYSTYKIDPTTERTPDLSDLFHTLLGDRLTQHCYSDLRWCQFRNIAKRC